MQSTHKIRIEKCRGCNRKLPRTFKYFFPADNPCGFGATCKRCLKEHVKKLKGTKRRCRKCKRLLQATMENFGINRGYLLGTCRQCKHPFYLISVKKYKLRHPKRVWVSKLISAAKWRADKFKVLINPEDIRDLALAFLKNKNKRCPICNNLMTMNGRGIRVASLDKIIPSQGYIKGNIAIICYRCNILKKDGNIKEFENIVKFLKTINNGGIVNV